MITKKELNPNGVKLLPAGKLAFERLYSRINEVRRWYGKPMFVTSGVRSYLDQLRIDKAAGRKPAYGSMHLIGAAVDIADKNHLLWNWLMDNMTLVEQWGIYLEDKRWTDSWVHCQIIAPKSGKRIFQPYEGPPPKPANKREVYWGPADKYKPKDV